MPTTPTIRNDLLQDSSVTAQYNTLGQPLLINIDRSFWVDNIPQDNPELVTTIALATVQASVPVASPHPSAPLALARNYRVSSGLTDKAMRVTVTYYFSADGYLDNQWTIESTSFLEQTMTDSAYDDSGNLVPISVDNYYLEWKFGEAQPSDPPLPPAYGTCQVLKPRKRVVMTKTIYSSDAATTFESASGAYIGACNLGTFRGGAVYTWLCMDASVLYEPLRGINTARLEFVYRPEGWYEYARFWSEKYGTPPNTFRNDSNGNSNGIKKTNPYLTMNFNTLVGLL